MKIYKLAQTDRQYSTIRNGLRYIFGELSKDFGTAPVWNDTYMVNVSIEKHDSADIRGESWIQVWHSRNYLSPSEGYSIIHLERYYESEHMQNAYGKTAKVKFYWDQPKAALDEVRSAIQKMTSEI
jgi:hypothetical protein